MDAVQRLLLLVAQRRGVLTMDLGMVSDVVMTYKASLGEEAQTTVCEPDVEAAADKLASEIAGSGAGRRP
jgi:hypothetical protein